MMRDAGRWRAWGSRVTQAQRAVRQLFGVPDYQRYREHMLSRHPDSPVLTEREFHALAIERRYGGSGPKCC